VFDERRFVLSVGGFPDLLWTRAQILQSAGYRVISTSKPEEADASISRSDCGVLLLCYSAREQWREHLIRRFRDHCPQGRIVAITNVPFSRPPIEADDFVYGIEGPEALLNAIAGHTRGSESAENEAA
jgi:hypothetical protein